VLILRVGDPRPTTVEGCREALHARELPVTLSGQQLQLGELGSVELSHTAAGWKLECVRAHAALAYAIAIALAELTGGSVEDADGVVQPLDALRPMALRGPVVHTDEAAAEALNRFEAGDLRWLLPLRGFLSGAVAGMTLHKLSLRDRFLKILTPMACEGRGEVAVTAAQILGRRPTPQTRAADPVAEEIFRRADEYNPYADR
jgi:hypothetical protein